MHSIVARAEEKAPEAAEVVSTMTTTSVAAETTKEDAVISRVYDSTVIGEPLAIGKDRRRVWEKLMDSRIVYLGEAEQVPVREDKVLELEIVRSLKNRCSESERTLSVAIEAFPCDLQEQIDKFMDGRFVCSISSMECWCSIFFSSPVS